MNYSKLLEGKTRSEIHEMADNWRNRYKKFNDKYKPDFHRVDRVHRIYKEMIKRFSTLIIFYITIKKTLNN